MIWHSFCFANSWKILPRCLRISPYSTLRRYLGTKTTWYLQSHFERRRRIHRMPNPQRIKQRHLSGLERVSVVESLRDGSRTSRLLSPFALIFSQDLRLITSAAERRACSRRPLVGVGCKRWLGGL